MSVWPQDEISTTLSPLRPAFIALEVSEYMWEGPPYRGMLENRCVSLSYLQRRSRTLCLKCVLRVWLNKRKEWGGRSVQVGFRSWSSHHGGFVQDGVSLADTTFVIKTQ